MNFEEFEIKKGDFYGVRIRGLPWSATKDEIRNFFEDCTLARDAENSIVITKNREGKPTGEAHIIFATQDDFDKAMLKDRKNMGRRYIEIFKAKPEELDYAMNRDETVDINEDNLLKLRGLPWGSTVDDVKNFFDGIDINPGCIMVVTDHNGRSSGEAFVQFSSKEDTKEAMKNNRKNIGSRYIELFPSNMKEAYNAKMWSGSSSDSPRGRIRPGPYDRSYEYGRGFGRNIKTFGRGQSWSSYGDLGGFSRGLGGMKEEGGGSFGHCIRMRGLPFSASERNVLEWFSPTSAVPLKVVIDYNREGRPSGDGKAYFRTADDAKKAMGMDKQNMAHRYIELFDEGVDSNGFNPSMQAIDFNMGKNIMNGTGMNLNTNMGIGFGYQGGMSVHGTGFDISKMNTLMKEMAQQQFRPFSFGGGF